MVLNSTVNDHPLSHIKMIERKPLFPDLENVKAKSEGEPVADQAGAHLRFLHATVGVFLLSPGWDTSLSHLDRTLIARSGGERTTGFEKDMEISNEHSM